LNKDHDANYASLLGQKEDIVLASNVHEFRACALMDSGVSIGMASGNAMDWLQTDEPGLIDRELEKSNMSIMVRSGKKVRPGCKANTHRPVDGALPLNSTVKVNVVGQDIDNNAPITIGMGWLVQNKAIGDFGRG